MRRSGCVWKLRAVRATWALISLIPFVPNNQQKFRGGKNFPLTRLASPWRQTLSLHSAPTQKYFLAASGPGPDWSGEKIQTKCIRHHHTNLILVSSLSDIICPSSHLPQSLAQTFVTSLVIYNCNSVYISVSSPTPWRQGQDWNHLWGPSWFNASIYHWKNEAPKRERTCPRSHRGSASFSPHQTSPLCWHWRPSCVGGGGGPQHLAVTRSIFQSERWLLNCQLWFSRGGNGSEVINPWINSPIRLVYAKSIPIPDWTTLGQQCLVTFKCDGSKT